LLFILGEIWFFAAFFWGFFHYSFNPAQELGLIWPPVGIYVFNPFNVPLLNTAILVSSGATVTWAHHRLLTNKSLIFPIISTLILGIYFTFLQGIEYFISRFSIRDRAYGSVFFIATGFHGLHVLIGTTFLTFCFFRFLKNLTSAWNHLGFELAIWYWHFVDVVWLFLFSCIYWWGS
jgi:cytochrome c oxidase subunit 3